ncbi:MAG: hypothetical protein PHH47_08245 [Gallionella sp.]|nr:hypothetical protein [Gallionella sp.]MDD4947958.1 hypothetical protein [Gallionella sp.]MDD5612322.1 hypothetical protein [Gallionella sp.]
MLLLSLSLAAKRRPADLVEIATAISLTQGTIPGAPTLSDAYARLSACGLIIEMDGGYALPAEAQQMLVSLRKNDDNDKKLARIMEQLAKYPCKGEHPCIRISPELLVAATRAARKASSEKSMLSAKPKPKPVWISKKDLDLGRKHLPPGKKRKA